MPPNSQQPYNQAPQQPVGPAPVYVDPYQQYQQVIEPPVPQPQMQPQPSAQPQTAPQMQPQPQTQIQPQMPPANPGATPQAAGPGQTPAKKKDEQKATSTQKTLLMSELRDSMIIMGDGGFRAVIACKSINFDLMSSREREAVEYSYQNFLNALTFPVQIFIRSQRVDIGPYLDRLESIRVSQDNMLLSVLMDDYIQFVDILSQEANIMDKTFYVIVPYSPTGDLNSVVEQSKGFFSQIFGGAKGNTTITKIDKTTYEKAKDEIRNRVDAVLSGLLQVGISATQLSTRQLGELYYNMYNPDTAVREPLGDFQNITSTYVRRGTGTPPPPRLPGEQIRG